MSLKKKPVTGMKDISTSEMEIREYLIDIIKDTYKSYGFTSIETPIIEHIENLCSNQGGDNEKLIFKILKRGEKLRLDEAENESDLVDSGLRYDLTLPLSRYYANNEQNLQKPFKALQIGSVFRAERPQKGRFRQFTQCDIDIIGEDGYMAEVELISATSEALSKICPDQSFSVRINDRRILKAMIEYSGIEEDKADKALICLDKLDKIGFEGVFKELVDIGIEEGNAEKYLSLIEECDLETEDSIAHIGEILKDNIDADVINNLMSIVSLVKNINSKISLIFDKTLVRGMGYYTGPIFEVSMDGLSSSVAGGGRYDKMIGKFSQNDIPACGFSIGFERIVTILSDKGFIPQRKQKKAILYDKNVTKEQLGNIIKDANFLREKGDIVLVTKMNKNKKFQKEKLSLDGFTEFIEIFND